MGTMLKNETRTARKEHSCQWCLGKIEKGKNYEYSSYTFDGSVYNWKNHISCQEIASKLKMFDECDEGLTGEDFRYGIRLEFQEIMSLHHNELYESEFFSYPDFEGQLKFVLEHHKIGNHDPKDRIKKP